MERSAGRGPAAGAVAAAAAGLVAAGLAFRSVGFAEVPVATRRPALRALGQSSAPPLPGQQSVLQSGVGGSAAVGVLGAAAAGVVGGVVAKQGARAAARQRVVCRARQGKRVVPGQTWFDLTLPAPLGLQLKDVEAVKGAFVEDVLEGGSVFDHNEKNILPADGAEEPLQWVQPGDQLIQVDDKAVLNTEEAAEAVAEAKNKEAIALKFSRRDNGPVQVVFADDGPNARATTPFKGEVRDAAMKAGHFIDLQCDNGSCGSCWHVCPETNEIYIFCVSGVRAGELPSKTTYNQELSIFFDPRKEEQRAADPDKFHDVMEPLILKRCPEIYERWSKTGRTTASGLPGM